MDAEPLESLWYEMYNHQQEASPPPPVQRGGLTQEHLNPIASRHWKSVLSWIAFHPDQLSVLVDREGQTALHHACLFRAPAHVVEAMLYSVPELAEMANDQGELALHWAIRLATPVEVLKLLLTAYPAGPGSADHTGQTPLSLLWDRHQEDLVELRGLSEVEESASWRRILLLVEGYNDRQLPSTPVLPLHAFSACPCPQSLFEFVLQVYIKDVSVTDENGRLPLAIVASTAVAGDRKLRALLKAYPAAASIPDRSGRLPLHEALVAGKIWDEGVEILLEAQPRALTTRDLPTKLYPFQLAALKERKTDDDSDLTTIYSLLRADPSLVLQCTRE